MSPVPLDQRAAKLAARRSALAQAGFPVFIRFDDLVAGGIVKNWTTLSRLINAEKFPTGVMIGQNSRAWLLTEVQEWLASRPSARKITPPDAIHPRVRDSRRAEKALARSRPAQGHEHDDDDMAPTTEAAQP